MAGELKTSEEVQIFQEMTEKFAQRFISGFPQINANCEQETWRKGKWRNFAEKNSAETLKSSTFTCRPLINLEPLLKMFYQANLNTLSFWKKI